VFDNRIVAAVLQATSAAEHERNVEEWASDVWAAWEPHHTTVRIWIGRGLAV
jgi:hypothetical protein